MPDITKKQNEIWWDAVAEEELYRLFIYGDMSVKWLDDVTFWHSGREDAKVIMEILKDRGRVIKDLVFVEIGCGVGRVGYTLIDKAREYIGVDVSKNMRDLFHQYFPDVRALTPAQFHKMKTGFADVVFSVHSMQHMPKDSVREYINTAYRVLKPGGYLLFQLICDDKQPYIGYRPQDVTKIKNHKALSAVMLNPWTATEFAELVNGFEVEKEGRLKDHAMLHIWRKPI